MAFESNHLQEAREKAEERFPAFYDDVAKYALDAFQFECLEIMLRADASSASYYDDRMKKTEKAMGDLKFDLGPDGEEPLKGEG